ncbi:MAG: D-tyrosyl-tRNA(Tyr) deacylase [Clostridia bacterium]|nr:D-tyrosyl-tRNA(Tyr) deacylase [Clostridia bacterium]
MKLVIQRVKKAKVDVEEKTVGKIGKGFLVFVGITHTDTKEEADFLAKKLCNLRVFEDNDNKMNLALKDVKGELLIISQFTLYANTKDGNRPSFTDAAKSEVAEPLYEYFLEKCREYGIKVEKGIFGADMQVSLLNDGPVTIIIEK